MKYRLRIYIAYVNPSIENNPKIQPIHLRNTFFMYYTRKFKIRFLSNLYIPTQKKYLFHTLMHQKISVNV